MKKKLLIFAHRGEAKPFLNHFDFSPVPKMEGFYEEKDHYLLITGEGPWKAGPKLAYILGRFEASEVINLGIAGALRTSIELESIHPIRNVYLEQNSQMQFASHALGPKGLDLITCHSRVLDSKKSDLLDAFAPLVDRELWAIAQAAEVAGVETRAYKLISDIVGQSEICERVKEKSELYSQKLLDFFLNLDKNEQKKTEDKSELNWEGFYFTTSLENKREKLLSSLKIKFGSLEQALKEADIESIRCLEVLPKKKAILLVEKMQSLLNPVQKELSLSLEEISLELTRAGAQIKFPRDLERPSFNLSAHIEKPEDIAILVKAMENFDYLRLINLIEGRALNV
ncbi:MAG: nucleoside phosphorylase [Bacteriovoracaceae bacterium]|jgi:nucleoside phosphorylase